MKKVIDDAEEILSELNFTSDVIVREIEEKINHLNMIYKSVNNSIAQVNIRTAVSEPQVVLPKAEEPHSQPKIEKTIVNAKFKPITIGSMSKDTVKVEKPKSKQQQIFEMADKGISVLEIAKAMNMGQGEVALILSLKNEEN
jgi:serine phosphatase RsbU (regulator of sigma subunit)